MDRFYTNAVSLRKTGQTIMTVLFIPCMMFTCMMFSINIKAQTILISPTGDGGFENGASFAANGWTLVNGATNQWFVGPVAIPSSGTNSAYISDNVGGATYNYVITAASTVHFYRDITFPAGETNIVLTFKWKAQGELNYDYITVYSIPTSTTPTVNNPAGGFQSWLNIPVSYPGAVVLCTPPNLNLQGAYQTQTICLPASYAGTSKRIVFMWSNDGSVGVQPPGSVDEISMISSLPPTAPSNQPTSLMLTPFSVSQINGSYTSAIGSPDGYITVRYPSGALPTNPVNGVTYAPGNTLGLGRVVSVGSATSFSATGLSPNTTYDFYIYSFNNAPCASGPLYNITNPLFGTASTPPCSALAAGTYTVGPTGTYPSLTAVTAALASGTAGPVLFELQSTYLSAVETFPITFGVPPCPSMGSVTIRPETGSVGLSIVSGNATGTLLFDGGSNITFDGRAGGVGSSQLTISNTAITGYAIQFINSAGFNTIKYCSVTGVNTSPTNGVIVFNTTTSLVTGNSNNTISNCDIHDGATTPTNLVYVNGSTTNYNVQNNNNTISNCLLHDWFNATSTTLSAAINIVAGASDWTITGNSFYQSVTRNFTMITATDQGAIFITSATLGTNFTISNNFIGGSAPMCGGAPWTYTGGATGTPTVRMIRLTAAVGSFSNIVNNTLTNIAITSSTTNNLSGLISHVSGNVNITGNTLGSQSTTGAVTFTLASVTAGTFYLPLGFGLGAVPCTINVTNNNIGGITTTTSSTGSVSFRVVYGQPVVGNIVNVSDNLIGGTVANSIQQLTNNIFTGILMLNPVVGGVYSNNTVRNLTLNNVGVTGSLRGIDIQSSGGRHTVTGNTIFNLTTNATNIQINNAASIVGITVTGSLVGGTNVSGNTIYNLTNTNASVAGWINGMYFATSLFPQPTTTVSKNFVHSINLSSATAGMAGIFLPNTGNALVYNNMVRLGIDDSGAPITTSLQINGIYKASTGSMGIYFNTVYIGGTGVASGAVNSYAFRRASSGPVDTVMNNIFYNSRSNASGTGKHYAANLNANTALLENFNDLLADGTGGVLGLLVATDYATLPAWQAATNQDWNSVSSDPKLVNPTGNSATVDLHIQGGVATAIEQAGFNLNQVSLDFDLQARAGLTPVDIGADAGNFLLMDIAPPVIYYTPLINYTCSTGDRILAGVNITDATGIPTVGSLRPRIYYKKNAGSFFSQPGTLISGSATNSNWDFTIVAADMGGLVPTDVVSYFVIAQDIVVPPNIGSNPAGVIATDVNTVTTPPVTLNTYTVTGTSLSGTYTVGAAGAYPTLTAAVTAYNTACLTGPVLFSLIDPSYSVSETFPITINANPYSSAVNTLTIKPTLPGTTITGSSATGLIILNGADYVTIDGSISNTVNTICPPATATRDLTITNSNVGTTSAVIWLQTVTTGLNAASNNTIKNLNLLGNGNTQTLFGVGSGSSTIGITSLGTLNNNNSFINNNISKTQYGIYSQGLNLGVKNTGTVINQNLINTIAPNNTARGGIVVGFENNISISGNTISEIALASTPDVFGIAAGGISITTTAFAGNEVTNAVITNNVIGSVRNTGTSFSACGIFLATAISGTNLIANNMISGVSGNPTPGDLSVGMLLGGGQGSVTKVYYNTVTMTSSIPLTGSTSPSFALAVGGVNPVVDIRNNILVNTQNNGTGNNYAIAYGYVPFTNLTSDHNDYYVPSGATFFTGGIGGLAAPINQLTLANLQAATGKDGFGQTALPTFVSTTNLHLATTGNQCLDGDGTPIAGLDTDIDCQIRSATTPDIGADEFTSTSISSVTIAETSGLANNDGIICAGATVTLTAIGGGTYLWSTGEMTNIITPAPITTTVYTVSITNGTCTEVLGVTITVTPLPMGSIAVAETSGITSNDGIICAGAPVTLTASGGVAYMWSTGSSSNPIMVNPLSTTTYTVTVTNGNACSSTATTTITVNPLPSPIITVTPGSIVCAPQTITLDAGAGYTSYSWSNGGLTQSIMVASTGIYSVTVTDANGCSGSTSTSVTVNPMPLLSETHVEPSDCFSNNGSIDLTVLPEGSYSYNWFSGTGTGIVNGMEDQSGLSIGTYNVTVTNTTTLCTSTLSILLSVPEGCGGCDSVSSVSVSPNPICLGNSATFTAIGTLPGATFAWFDAPIGGMQVGTGNPFVSGPLLGTTTYCVEQTVIVPYDVTIDYSGEEQTWVVPNGVTSITVTAYGAQGGAGGTNNAFGAPGGFSTGTLAVVPGQTLFLYVGGQGASQNGGSGAGGFNGGANAGAGFYAGGGGGATDIRVGGNGLANRAIIAGGGGGRGSGGGDGFIGGTGGGANGGNGTGDGFIDPGDGGTQAMGGAGGTGTPGVDGMSGILGIGGIGGSSQVDGGGGGGGGYYGGGGGEGGLFGTNSGAGGGGGSGYIGGVSSGTTINNVHFGNGSIELSFLGPCTSTRVCGTATLDVVPPNITCPANVTVQCANQVPLVNTASVTATDNAGGSPTITFVGDFISNQTCVNRYIVNRVYMATDMCANTTTCAQQITVFDNTPPSLTCPAGMIVPCASQVPAPNVQLVTTTDNCGGAATVTFVGDAMSNQTCINRFNITRTYRATDVCGNSSTCTQIISVFDNTAPTLTCPAGVTVQCASQVPPQNTALVTSTDNCGGAGTITFVSDVITNQTCTNRFNLIRTYRASDACGNSATCTQVITVFDNTPPTITCPANVTVQCASLVPAVSTSSVTSSDNCGGASSIAHLGDVITNMTCTNRFILRRTYRASDACGNSTTCVQTITVFDNTQPVITFTDPILQGATNGETVEVQCYGQDPEWDLPTFGTGSVSAIDNCSGNVLVTYQETLQDEGDCETDGYINLYRLRWTATDVCGNSSSITVYLALVDTIPPEIVGVPDDITVDCDEVPEPPDDVIARDECTIASIVLYHQSNLAPGCQDGQVITRSWTARDECGNVTVEQQHITLVDDEGPELEFVQPELEGVTDGAILSYTCNEGGIPDFYDLLDAESVYSPPSCGNNPVITFQTNTIYSNNCKRFGYIEQRTYHWSAVDACGNVTDLTIMVRLVDSEAPVFINIPEIACVNDPALNDVEATDNCGDPFVRYWDVQIPNPCGDGTAWRRTYEAYDDCGNITVDTTILIPNDQGNPILEFTNPILADLDPGEILIIDCGTGDGQYSQFGPDDVSVEDGCPFGVEVEFTETVIETRDCSTTGILSIIELTWSATDICGNASTLTVIAHVVDETDPVLLNFKPELTIGCNDPLPEISATDNCGHVSITINETIVPSQCEFEYDVLRQIAATDPCGNTTIGSQVIHVGDDSGPVIEGVEEEVCNDLTIPDVTAYDECAGSFVDVTYTDRQLESDCRDGIVIERTWTAVDACGDSTVIHQIIIVGDNTPPEILIPTFSIIRKFIDNLYNLVFLSQTGIIDQLNDLDESSIYVRDECDEQIIPVFTVDITYSDNCEEDGYLEHRVYTWVATDVCGNSSSITFSVDIMDDVPPVLIGVPADATIICAPLPPPPVIHSNDPAQPVNIVYTQTIKPGNAPGVFIVTRAWVATDACGNTSHASQIITWIPDTFLECDIIVPPSIPCNSHGVLIESDVTGGLGGVTYEWELVCDQCYIQSGQGTPSINIYVGWTEIEIILTVTDKFGCTTICTDFIDCIDLGPNGIAGSPQIINSETIQNQESANSFEQVSVGYLNDINLWPNPAKESVNLSFDCATDHEVQLSLTNFLGQKILTDNIDAIRGLNNYNMDVSKFPEGGYLIEMKTEKEVYTKVVVIIRND